MLDKGEVPWRKPWNYSGTALSLPRNYVSKKPYNGINVFLLLCTGFDCPFFVSYKQAKELGGCVRKGEKGFPVVFWKRLPKIRDGAPVIGSNGRPEMVFFLRYYTVFNLLQCEGIDWKKPEPVAKPEGWNPLTECESITAAMPKRPDIQHKGGHACYSPSLDIVRMPERKSFGEPSGYYATLFHELTHATGHKSRLARKGIDSEAGDWQNFGSASYAKEELVAEMGSAFLCGFAGISAPTLENSVAYIQNWRKAFKGDSKLVVMAAAQGQKAANYIRGIKKEETASE
jgi:antirestriction protein ArdC